MAPGAGLEPATNWLHLSSSFLKGWTISSPCPAKRDLSVLVSSLYGAPALREGRGSHGVSIPLTHERFSLHRYPKIFILLFPVRAALIVHSQLLYH